MDEKAQSPSPGRNMPPAGHPQTMGANDPPLDRDDEFSTTNTESLVNGSSVAVNLLLEQHEFKWHSLYSEAVPVTHPLDDNFGWVFLRGCAYHFAGLLIGVPLFIVLLLALLIVAPIRLLLWVIGAILPIGGRALQECTALAQDSCDPWWPLSTCYGPHTSLTQCIVTLQSPIDVEDARRAINCNVFGFEPVTNRSAAGNRSGNMKEGGHTCDSPLHANVHREREETALDRLIAGSSLLHTTHSHTRAFTAIHPQAQHTNTHNYSTLTQCAPLLPCCCSQSASSNAALTNSNAAINNAQTVHTSTRRRSSTKSGKAVYDVNDHVFDTHMLLRSNQTGSCSLQLTNALQVVPNTRNNSNSMFECNADANSLGANSTNTGIHASNPAPRRHRITSLRDLELYVNVPVVGWSRKRPPWTLKLLPQFGNLDEGTCCALVLLEMQSKLSHQLCPLRFLSLWTDGHLQFDVEPKYRRSFVFGGVVPPYNIFLTVSYGLWTVCQAVSASPLALLIGACRGPEQVWSDASSVPLRNTSVKYKIGKKKTDGTKTQCKRYRGVSCATNGSGHNTDKRHSASVASSLLIGNASLSRACYKRVTWARISNMDQLMRAERILRAATIELLLAFVAGALRRHFRAQGIRHPPNVRTLMPVANRDCHPVTRHDTCDFLMVPVEIPTGVEGNIPRIWAVQRNLSDALDEPFPLGARLAKTAGKLLLPVCASVAVQRSMYKDSACCVSFLRAQGEAALHQRRIHSILCYAPMPEHCRASFGFIQCGAEMVVTLTADTRIYAEPDTLLAYFQAEVLALLRQLSIRLMTLSQATYLPQSPQQPINAPSPPSTANEQPFASQGQSSERPLLTATPNSLNTTNNNNSCNTTAAAVNCTTSTAHYNTSLSPSSVFDYGPPGHSTTADVYSNTASVALTPTVTLDTGCASSSASQQHLQCNQSTSVTQANTPLMGGAGGRMPGGERQRSHSRSSRTSRSLLSEGVGVSVSQSHTRRSSSYETNPEDSASLEELEHLLGTVQAEMDVMRLNPQGDRGEYLSKLQELERKMEQFHSSIARRLPAAAGSAGGDKSTGSRHSISFPADSTVVEELLAPYWDEERLSSDRRQSRDSRRSSVVSRMARKRSSVSRRLDSPTRRLSPKVSSASQSKESLR